MNETTPPFVKLLGSSRWTPESTAAEGELLRRPLRSDEWMRVVPLGGLEQALIAASGVTRDARHEPQARTLVVDRKLAPRLDVMAISSSPRLVVSERFAEMLRASGAGGWSALPIPHFTPNAVHGARLLALDTTAFTGPFVNTAFMPRAMTGEGLPAAPPLPPVSFDGARGDGGVVAWSPWMGMRWPDWRALVIRGDILGRVIEAIPDLRLALAPVHVVSPCAPKPEPFHLETLPPPPPAPPLAEILESIVAGAVRHRHVLPPPATTAAIEAAERLASAPLPDAYVVLLRRMNGPSLFGGALQFFPAAPGPSGLEERGLDLRESGAYPFHEHDLPFAEVPGGRHVWVLDRQGRVHALGHDGITYGPDVPFATWLADQVADLAYVIEHRDQLAWAGDVLE